MKAFNGNFYMYDFIDSEFMSGFGILVSSDSLEMILFGCT